MGHDSEPHVDSRQLSERVIELERQLEEARRENDALRESEYYWRSLIQAAPVYLSIVDRDARLLFLNRPGEGYRPDEILGRSILDATMPEHREMVRQRLERVFKQGTTENYEACDVNQHRWYSTTVGPLYRNGEVVAAVQCSEDITEKREMRRELAEAESRWRSVLENAPDTVVLFNTAGEVRFINRTAEAYTEQEVVGRQGNEFLREEDRPAMAEAIARVFATGEAQDVEFTESRRGLMYQGRMALIGSLDGEPMAIGFMRDVTKEHLRQKELRASETRLRLAVHQAPIVLWTTDRELRFTSSMGAGLELLGTKINENVNLSLYEYLRAEDDSSPAIRAHLEALEGHSVEYTQTWNNRVFQSHTEPLREADGSIVGVVGVALDITARHDTEVQLRRTGSELETRVRERTIQLDALNRQLLTDIEQRQVVERELRESEERFRIIAETLPIAVVIVAKSNQKVLYSNRQTCELFAASSNEIYNGKVPLPCGDPTLNQACMAMLGQNMMLENREVEVDTVLGDRIWISVSAVGMQYRGEDAYLCGMIEITGRKVAEQELQQEKVLLMHLLDMNERDRQLIAYEIHDGFLQDVTAALMFLEAAQMELGDIQEKPCQQIEQSLELLRESLGEARRMINNLRPPVLEEAGIVPAVEELIRKMEDLYDLPVELKANLQQQRLAPALEMAIYRIIQEGLTNVQRHSHSPRAVVVIKEEAGHIRLEIRDFGIGFDPSKTPKKRYGLTGMQERASLLGGEAGIDSTPGVGTSIRVELPVVALRRPPKVSAAARQGEEGNSKSEAPNPK